MAARFTVANQVPGLRGSLEGGRTIGMGPAGVKNMKVL
jgi:hypothetical protein